MPCGHRFCRTCVANTIRFSANQHPVGGVGRLGGHADVAPCPLCRGPMGRRAEAIVQEAVSMLSQSEKWKQTPPPWAGDTQLLRVMEAQLCKTTLELCEEAVELDPAYAHAHCVMGHVLDIMVHDPREAARHFQLAAELSVAPDPVNHYNAARCWSNPNHTLDPPLLQESMKQFRASVAADSSFAPGHYNYALLLRQEDGDAAAAEKHYRAAIAADPADPRAHHNLACIVWKDNNDLSGAAELLQTTLKLVQNPVPIAQRPFSDCISGPMDAALCTQALRTVYREIHHAKLAREAAAMDEDVFRETYRTIVTEFGEVPNDIVGDRRILASQALLEDHPELLTETAANILVVDAMAVMFEKPGHAAVSLSVECMCHQSVLVQYILAVAKDEGAEPIEACKRFCKSLERGLVENAGKAAREKARKTKNRKKKGKHKGKQGQQLGNWGSTRASVGDWGSAAPEFEDDGGHVSRGRASQAFDDDIRVLCAKVREVAFRKREEMYKENKHAYVLDESGRRMTRDERVASTPGGVDPIEVTQEMPFSMRRCFVEHDLDSLHDVIVALKDEGEDTVYLLNRAAAAGLWIPASGTRPGWMREGYDAGPRKSREEMLALNLAGEYRDPGGRKKGLAQTHSWAKPEASPTYEAEQTAHWEHAMATSFGPDMMDRVRANPDTAPFLEDPAIVAKLLALQADPSQLHAAIAAAEDEDGNRDEPLLACYACALGMMKKEADSPD